jgi:hypothetical protein
MEQTNDQRLFEEWQQYLKDSEHQVEVAKEQVAYYAGRAAAQSYMQVMENPDGAV